jgi:hypothetical protein
MAESCQASQATHSIVSVGNTSFTRWWAVGAVLVVQVSFCRACSHTRDCFLFICVHVKADLAGCAQVSIKAFWACGWAIETLVGAWYSECTNRTCWIANAFVSHLCACLDFFADWVDIFVAGGTGIEAFIGQRAKDVRELASETDSCTGASETAFGTGFAVCAEEESWRGAFGVTGVIE